MVFADVRPARVVQSDACVPRIRGCSSSIASSNWYKATTKATSALRDSLQGLFYCHHCYQILLYLPQLRWSIRTCAEQSENWEVVENIRRGPFFKDF